MTEQPTIDGEFVDDPATGTDVQRTAGLGIAAYQSDWTAEQGQTLLEMFNLGGAPHAVLRSYFHVCKTTGLDPFKRQIHLIERQGKWTPQTSIDGFRMIRDRARVFDGGEIAWCGPDGVWVDVWLGSEPPKAAKYTLYRTDQSRPSVATALWDAYVQTKRDGSVTQMWARMGPHMLAKVAEALAIRMAFPDDTGGLYSDDEMMQAGDELVENTNHGGAPKRGRSPGIADTLLDSPGTLAAEPQPEAGGMAVFPEDPGVEDAEVVSDDAAAPTESSAPTEEAGEPADMSTETPAPPEPHAHQWSARLAEACESSQLDDYTLRTVYDAATAAGALDEIIPWAGGATFHHTVMAIRDNLLAGRSPLEGIA